MSAPRPLSPACFRFERLPSGILVTGDSGRWALLTKKEFSDFSSGKVREGSALAARLLPLNFFRERLDLEREAGEIGSLSRGLLRGTTLHILVLTLRCNHSCVYCRATCGGGGTDMTAATARRAVDLALSSPGPAVTLEFQGGEALLNWPVLKSSVDYALKANRKAGKDLLITVVTNLTLMDREKLAFLADRKVSVCTSLDGPADLHDANRRHLGGSAHASVVRWLGELKKISAGGAKDSLPSALMTTTRQSLGREKEIVDEYRRLGLGGIFLRPLSPIGYAGSVWDRIGYRPEEFGEFYRRALAYIMKLNRSGERFVERNAALLARKALLREDPNYLDLRSPCGAATGQLAYNWDGKVYTCDEGRMVGARGDGLFLAGKAAGASIGKLVSSDASRLCAMASCLESQHHCFRCAYKPYCGVCPVHNYETQGSPWGDIAAGGWCVVQKAVFGAVFALLASPKDRKILEGWLEPA